MEQVAGTNGPPGPEPEPRADADLGRGDSHRHLSPRNIGFVLLRGRYTQITHILHTKSLKNSCQTQ